MKFVFIADYFSDEVPGGGELNNEELIFLLKEETVKIKSSNVTLSFLHEHIDSKFIISNFIQLNNENKKFIENKCQYIIYEHDHKYLINRNPAKYKNFKAPTEAIINFEFYKNAKAVLCQSNFHKNIIKKNLNLDNIVSLGGNLWSEDILKKIESYSNKNKKDCYSIMHSRIPHKNTIGAINYCTKNKINYDLIGPCSYTEFLNRLSDNETFVFFPQTPETLSRVIVEARMMGMRVVTNSLVGASQEPWFKFKGKDLIEKMRSKRKDIPKKVMEVFKDEQ